MFRDMEGTLEKNEMENNSYKLLEKNGRYGGQSSIICIICASRTITEQRNVSGKLS